MPDEPNTQRDVAQDYMDAMARTAGVPPAPQPGHHPLPSGAEQHVTAWGVTSDPKQAIAELHADKEFMTALLDGGHVAHSAAVARQSALFKAAYGDERADTTEGNGSGNMSPAIHEGYQEPTEAEMRTQVTNTATGILERQGVDAETAADIAGLAVSAGLSTLDISTVADAIANSSRQYSTTGEVLAELGADADRLIAAAQAESNRLKLPPELLSLEIGGIVLGDHPALIRQLAGRRGVR